MGTASRSFIAVNQYHQRINTKADKSACQFFDQLKFRHSRNYVPGNGFCHHGCFISQLTGRSDFLGIQFCTESKPHR